MCSSELVCLPRSTAVRVASSASLEPSVANRILVGKMLISPSSLDTAERIMTSSRSPCIIAEDRFEVSHRYFLPLILLTISYYLRWCTPDASDTPVHRRGTRLFHLFAYLCGVDHTDLALPPNP